MKTDNEQRGTFYMWLMALIVLVLVCVLMPKDEPRVTDKRLLNDGCNYNDTTKIIIDSPSQSYSATDGELPAGDAISLKMCNFRPIFDHSEIPKDGLILKSGLRLETTTSDGTYPMYVDTMSDSFPTGNNIIIFGEWVKGRIIDNGWHHIISAKGNVYVDGQFSQSLNPITILTVSQPGITIPYSIKYKL